MTAWATTRAPRHQETLCQEPVVGSGAADASLHPVLPIGSRPVERFRMNPERRAAKAGVEALARIVHEAGMSYCGLIGVNLSPSSEISAISPLWP
jgi:hypothetical protein